MRALTDKKLRPAKMRSLTDQKRVFTTSWTFNIIHDGEMLCVFWRETVDLFKNFEEIWCQIFGTLVLPKEFCQTKVDALLKPDNRRKSRFWKKIWYSSMLSLNFEIWWAQKVQKTLNLKLGSSGERPDGRFLHCMSWFTIYDRSWGMMSFAASPLHGLSICPIFWISLIPEHEISLTD